MLRTLVFLFFLLLLSDIAISTSHYHYGVQRSGRAHLWPKERTGKHDFSQANCSWSAPSDAQYMHDAQRCYSETKARLSSQNIHLLAHAEPVQTHFELRCDRSSLLSFAEIKTSLSHFLRDRTIAILGDSVILQQFVVLGCMIHVLDLSEREAKAPQMKETSNETTNKASQHNATAPQTTMKTASASSASASDDVNRTFCFKQKNATKAQELLITTANTRNNNVQTKNIRRRLSLSDSTPSESTVKDFALPLNISKDELRVSVHIASTNTTLRHTRLGKIFANMQHYRPALSFELNRTLSRADIVVLNQGMHYNKESPFTKESKDPYSLEAIAIMTLQVYDEFLSKAQSTHTLSELPVVVWRETPPQNFPTNNGWYEPCKEGPCHCVSINATMLQGGKERETYPATYRNGLVEPYFRRNITQSHYNRDRIHSHRHLLSNSTRTKPPHAHKPASAPHILYNTIYDALNEGQESFPIHALSLDCTHMGVDALLFMNQALLSMIF